MDKQTEESNISVETWQLDVPRGALEVRMWRPERVRGTLQLVHGMSEHIRRYDQTARFFAARGFLVFGHDHRGHGPSARAARTLGQMGEWEQVVVDIERVKESALEHGENSASTPHVVLAHSMGSFMAQELILRDASFADAWILSGSNGKPPAIAAAGRLVARFERFRLSAKKPSMLLEKLSFGRFNDGFPGRTDFDWLSRDEAQVDAYVEDELCGMPLSTESWVGLLDGLPLLADPHRLRHIEPMSTPILIIGGGDDPVSEKATGLRKLERAYAAAGLSDVVLRVYDDARHEVLNETNRAEVWNDIADFVGFRLGLADLHACDESSVNTKMPEEE